ncbi:MAG: thioredoxin family protein [Proteobacteria bacterium]|nr:thioredoxin family protein [Pseudomonadota bacterium]
MMRFLAALLLLLAASFPAASLPALAQIDEAPKVHARLIAETSEVAPGGTVSVALEELIRPGWHTYWVNAGDAGAPTAIKWILPPGWKAGDIQWPYPKRLPVGPLMDYGYENAVWLISPIAAAKDARPGDVVTIRAQANWLVCKEICVPEEAELSLTLAVSASPAAPYATVEDRFAAWRAKIPTPSPFVARFKSSDTLDLFIAEPSLAKMELRDASFFPLQNGIIAGAEPQKWGTADRGIIVRMTPDKKASTTKTLDGVVVLSSSDGSTQALSIKATRGEVPAASFGSGVSFALALFFALLGGLILNIMPCVLPILAMKALAVASHASDHPRARREGLAYGLGAVLSFAALGLILVVLRAGGEAAGWGFQLQEPIAVASFALLMFAVGLNLSGVFEFSRGFSGGGALAGRGGSAGSFFTGVLAVAVAAPCTAPFMAAALGFALTEPTLPALAIFVALGAGFALPFVAIAFAPGLLRFVPKPGAWMERFKQALAFPMYATAAWLLWVLAQESGANAVLLALIAMVALALAAWSWMQSRNASAPWRGIGFGVAVLALAVVVATLFVVRRLEASPQAVSVEISGLPHEAYSEARLAQLRAENRPVFINATAAWCITCLVNERAALSSDDVRQAFAKHNVAYLVADWTSRNAEISALLSAHGRAGVPLYLYYAPGASEAIVLPQVLTSGAIVAAVEGKP